jgi:hypothetical protein
MVHLGTVSATARPERRQDFAEGFAAVAFPPICRANRRLAMPATPAATSTIARGQAEKRRPYQL